jgi:hypothetical protein
MSFDERRERSLIVIRMKPREQVAVAALGRSELSGRVADSS